MAGTEITGIIEQVNGRGFRLQGRDGWLNVSQYARLTGAPQRGQRVRVKLDGQGFVRNVTPIQGEQATPTPSTNGNGRHAPHSAPSERPDRDVIVTRLAVLNTATAILSSGARPAAAEDVVKLAKRLEEWATRPEGQVSVTAAGT